MVRIVRTADEIEAGILYQLHVAVNAGLRDSVGPASVILMDVGTVEKKMLAVDEKPLVGRPFDRTDAKSRAVFVDRLLADGDSRHRRVETRMVGMPELRLRDCGARLIHRHGGSSRNGLSGGQAGHGLSGRIEDLRRQLGFARSGAFVAHLGFHVNRGGILGDGGRCDEGAIPRHVERAGDHEPDIAIKPAREDVIARAGREAGVPVVVQAHGEHVGAQHVLVLHHEPVAYHTHACRV